MKGTLEYVKDIKNIKRENTNTKNQERILMKKLITSLASICMLIALIACSSTAVMGQDGEMMMSEANSSYATVNGIEMFYREAGSGQGIPVILIHGWPLNSKLFMNNMEAIASDNCHVYAVDLRGFGNSEMGNMNPSEMMVSDYADDVLAFMDEMGIERAVIGGMSMGGPIVFSMYEQAPDPFMGMLLFDTVAAAAPPFEKHLWIGWTNYINKKGVKVIPKMATDEMLTAEARMNNMELVKTVKGLMKEASKQGAIAGAHALAYRPNFRPMLGQIEVPVLILVGMQDTIYPPSFSKHMNKNIPNSTLVVIENGSHAAVIEEPEQNNEAINGWMQENRDEIMAMMDM